VTGGRSGRAARPGSPENCGRRYPGSADIIRAIPQYLPLTGFLFWICRIAPQH